MSRPALTGPKMSSLRVSLCGPSISGRAMSGPSFSILKRQPVQININGTLGL